MGPTAPLSERLSAVGAHSNIEVRLVQPVVVFWIDQYPRKIKGSSSYARRCAHLCPGFAKIFRAIERALLCFDNRINDVGTCGRHRQCDTAQFGIGQTFAQFLPGLSAISTLVKPASRSSRSKEIRRTPKLPHTGINDVRFLRIDRDIGAASILVDVQDLLPGLAAVSSLEHTALLIAVPEMTRSSHVNDIGVFGIDYDASDPLRVFKSHEAPRIAGVG